MSELESELTAHKQPAPTPGLAALVVDCASDALGSAFVVWMLGGAAISIAGSFAGEMVPSPPPGFAGGHSSEAHGGGPHHAWWHEARVAAFGLLFALFFAHSVGLRLRYAGVVPKGRMWRAFAKLREHWFGLIVGNAIGAWVATLFVGMAQDFSLVAMVWDWVAGIVLAGVREFACLVLGTSRTHNLGDWLSWYDANQTKLNFWLLYLGATCDDLGLPNFKTLARWAWRRLQKPKPIASSAAPGQNAPTNVP